MNHPTWYPEDTINDIEDTISDLGDELAHSLADHLEYESVDHGIGAYECWGHKGVQTIMGIELQTNVITVDVTHSGVVPLKGCGSIHDDDVIIDYEINLLKVVPWKNEKNEQRLLATYEIIEE